MQITNYKECELDICPDCGGDLDGEYCHDCEIKWEFKKRLNKTQGGSK